MQTHFTWKDLDHSRFLSLARQAWEHWLLSIGKTGRSAWPTQSQQAASQTLQSKFNCRTQLHFPSPPSRPAWPTQGSQMQMSRGRTRFWGHFSWGAAIIWWHPVGLCTSPVVFAELRELSCYAEGPDRVVTTASSQDVFIEHSGAWCPFRWTKSNVLSSKSDGYFSVGKAVATHRFLDCGLVSTHTWCSRSRSFLNSPSIGPLASAFGSRIIDKAFLMVTRRWQVPSGKWNL